jgi:SMI1 / KNR4 family (SUKH-1)
MLPGFASRGPVVGAAEVAAFEGRCGFSLPADYRQFLLDQNGGERIARCGADEEDEGGEPTGIVQFFSLGSAASLPVAPEVVARDPEAWPEEFELLANDLDWVMTNCRDAGTRSYPPELLPIAEVSLGVLLLRLKGRGTGTVVHCYDPDGYEPGHVNRVSRTFAELLRDLDDHELA